MHNRNEDVPEGSNAADYEKPIWSFVIFGLALLASQVTNVWVDNHYLDIVQMVRSWIK